MPLNGACRKRAQRRKSRDSFLTREQINFVIAEVTCRSNHALLAETCPEQNIRSRGDASWSGQVPGGGTDGRLVGVAQSGNATVASFVRAPAQTFRAEGAVTRVHPSC